MNRFACSVAILATAIAPAAAAQSAGDLLGAAIKAYENLQFADAAGFLVRALQRPAPDGLAGPQRVEALSYLAAVEVQRGRPDSAAAVFERVLLENARYRPDALIFPPEVTRLFAEVRRQVKVVHAALPADTALVAGRDQLTIRLVASSFHEIETVLRRETGETARTLYRGPIGDTLHVRWDGLDDRGAVMTGGWYRLVVTSRTQQGRFIRELQVPLEVETRLDTLQHPVLPDSLFLVERWTSGPAIESLLSGLLIGGAVTVLPSRVVGGNPSMGARFAVAGTVALGGLVGFVLQRPGRPIPQNIRANEALRREFREQTAAVLRENTRRRSAIRLILRAGTPVLVHAEQS